MIRIREASSSVRRRLASSSPRRPRLQLSATISAPPPRIQKLSSSEVVFIEHRGEHGAAHHRGYPARGEQPRHAAERLARDHAREHRLGDHLAGDERGAADHGRGEGEREPGAAGEDKLAAARQRAGADDHERQPPRRRQLAVEHGADQAARTRAGEQEAVAAGAEIQRLLGVHTSWTVCAP